MYFNLIYFLYYFFYASSFKCSLIVYVELNLKNLDLKKIIKRYAKAIRFLIFNEKDEIKLLDLYFSWKQRMQQKEYFYKLFFSNNIHREDFYYKKVQ